MKNEDEASRKANDNKLPKVEDPVKNSKIILHYRPSKAIWDWLILALTFYTAVAVPLVVSFRITSRNIAWKLIDTMFDILFLIDIVVNFHTTYVGPKGRLVTNLRKIRLRYISTWFVIDLLSCLPYESLNLVIGEVQEQHMAALLGALKACRLLRIARIARDVDRYLAHTWATLIALIFLILLIAHWMACGWYAVSFMEVVSFMQVVNNLGADKLVAAPRIQSDSRPAYENTFHVFQNSVFLLDNVTAEDEIRSTTEKIYTTTDVSTLEAVKLPRKNWLLRLADCKNQPFSYNCTSGVLTGGPHLEDTYTSSLYFTMTSVTSAGYGNIAADTMNEMIYCVFIMLFGALLYAAILGNVTNILQQLNALGDKFSAQLRAIKDFARLHDLPPKLTENVIDYVTYKWFVTHGIETDQILHHFPEHKQAEIRAHLHKKVLEDQPVFRALSENGTWILAKLLNTLHAAPDDILCDKGERLESISFIVSGCVEVSQDGAVVALLTAGDSFGTYFWADGCSEFDHMQSEVTIKALTYTNIDYVFFSDLSDAMVKFPAINRAFKRQLQLTYDQRRQLNLRTLTSVEWEREARNDPEVQRKQERLRKWLKRVREKKASRTHYNAARPKATGSKPSERKEQSSWKRRFFVFFKFIISKVRVFGGNKVKPEERVPKTTFQAPVDRIVDDRSPSEEESQDLNPETSVDGGDNKEDKSLLCESTKKRDLELSKRARCRQCGKALSDFNPGRRALDQKDEVIGFGDNWDQDLVGYKNEDFEVPVMKKNNPTSLKEESCAHNVKPSRVCTEKNNKGFTVMVGKCFRKVKDERSKVKWVEVGTIEFTLEEMIWKEFTMSEETREMFTSLLKLKTNFEKSLSNLDQQLAILRRKTSHLKELMEQRRS